MASGTREMGEAPGGNIHVQKEENMPIQGVHVRVWIDQASAYQG